MTCIDCGLKDAMCKHWGYPYLKKTRSEYEYCDCGHCEGHEKIIDLPESEWYWAPKHRRVDMSGVFNLENKPSKLLAFVNQMPQDDPIHRPIDWTKVSYE